MSACPTMLLKAAAFPPAASAAAGMSSPTQSAIMTPATAALRREMTAVVRREAKSAPNATAAKGSAAEERAVQPSARAAEPVEA